MRGARRRCRRPSARSASAAMSANHGERPRALAGLWGTSVRRGHPRVDAAPRQLAQAEDALVKTAVLWTFRTREKRGHLQYTAGTIKFRAMPETSISASSGPTLEKPAPLRSHPPT